MVENKASEHESQKEQAESRYEDKDRQFNRRVMDELYSKGLDGAVSLSKVFETEKNARGLTFSDLSELAGTFEKDSPSERKVKSFIYSEAAKQNVDQKAWPGGVLMDESRLVSQLGAAKLADLNEANVGKDKAMDQWSYDFKKSYADAASVATTYGIVKGVVAMTEHGGWVGAGVAAALAAGGALNNVIAGREMTDISGYVRNAGAYGLMNHGAEMISSAGGGTLANYGNGFVLGSAYKSLDYISGDKNLDGQAFGDVLFAGISSGFMVGLAGGVAKGIGHALPALATKDSSLLLSITAVGTNAFSAGADSYQKKAFLENAWQKASMITDSHILEKNGGQKERALGQDSRNVYDDAVEQQRNIVAPNPTVSNSGESSPPVKADAVQAPAADLPAPNESVPAASPQLPARIDLPNYGLTRSNSMDGLAKKSLESILHNQRNH